MQQNDKLDQKLSAHITRERSQRERVGIYIQAGDARDAVRRIQEAENAGVGQAWMALGGAGFADALTVLAIAAAQTETITLGTSIVPAITRHPLVMAHQALAIYDIAPDRLRLGIGSGNIMFLESHYGQTQSAPLSFLKEYLTVLRGILWEGKIEYQGKFFRVSDTLSRTAPIPLQISALGLKAFKLAGEIADGALPSLCPVPYLLDQAYAAMQAGAEEQARPVPPIIACLPVALSTDDTAVYSSVRNLLQRLLQAGPHAHMFAQAGWSSAVDGDEKALQALIQSLVISGSEAAVQDRIRELLTGGVDELQLLPIPIANEAVERKQLLNLIGTL